ncbi:MAG: thiamine phosphate synthase [Gemmatimonadota bacterium]
MSGLAERLAVMAITDPRARTGTLEATRAALRAGVPAIQLRWKNATAREINDLGEALRRLTLDVGALLIVNDRVDIALAIGADGAHLGDDDLPLPAARRIVPRAFVLGRSVDTAEEAAAAQAQGADYVGLGPVFETGSKSGLGDAVGLEGIAEARRRVSVPIVAIGGLDEERAAGAIAAGAAGVAVLAAIMHAHDPEAAAGKILAQTRKGRNSD